MRTVTDVARRVRVRCRSGFSIMLRYILLFGDIILHPESGERDREDGEHGVVAVQGRVAAGRAKSASALRTTPTAFLGTPARVDSACTHGASLFPRDSAPSVFCPICTYTARVDIQLAWRQQRGRSACCSGWPAGSSHIKFMGYFGTRSDAYDGDLQIWCCGTTGDSNYCIGRWDYFSSHCNLIVLDNVSRGRELRRARDTARPSPLPPPMLSRRAPRAPDVSGSPCKISECESGL